MTAETCTDLRPCKGCARPIVPPARWCSDACFRDTEGPLDDPDDER